MILCKYSEKEYLKQKNSLSAMINLLFLISNFHFSVVINLQLWAIMAQEKLLLSKHF